MKLATITKYACILAIVNAKKLSPSNEGELGSSASAVTLKVPTSQLVPMHIVLDPNVSKKVNLVPLNPFNEDLLADESLETGMVSIQPYTVSALASVSPTTSEVAALPSKTKKTDSTRYQIKTTQFSTPTAVPTAVTTVYQRAVPVMPQHALTLATKTISNSTVWKSTATAAANTTLAQKELSFFSNSGARLLSFTSTVGIVLVVGFVAFFGAM